MDGQQQIIHRNHKQGGFENCLAFWTNRPLRGQALDETNKQYSFKAYLEIILKTLEWTDSSKNAVKSTIIITNKVALKIVGHFGHMW